MSQTMEVDSSSMREIQEPEKKQKSRRPANTAFRQQRLKAWQPILTPKTVLPLFFAIGVIFAPIGGALLYASAKVQQITIDYSDCSNATTCPEYENIPSSKVTTSFKNSTPSADVPRWCNSKIDVPYGSSGYSLPTNSCHIQFHNPDTLSAPVFLYYQLTNFYQNHRRYVNSYDQDQLKGTFRTYDDIKNGMCTPLAVNTTSQKAYYPCGLIANSLFNDTFHSPVLLNAAGSSSGSQTYNMTSDNIAWSTDADLYGSSPYQYGEVLPPPNWQKRYPDGYNASFPFPDLHTDQQFQVWMRTAGLPTFSKLALRNDDTDMTPGTYEIEIYDDFPVNMYQGTKSILISTRTIMGGKNPFLGIAYIVVGGLCILLGAMFTVTQLIKPRKLGDHSYLSWNTDQPSSATASGRAPRPGDSA